MPNIIIGSDPEFPILFRGRSVSAAQAGLPERSFKRKVYAGEMFRDGWNLEINPIPSEYLSVHYRNALSLIRIAKSDLALRGLTLGNAPAYRILQRDLEKAPPDCIEFGCHPTQNAYLGGAQTLPELDGYTHLVRYAGAHLHFSARLSGMDKLGDPLPLAKAEDYPTIVRWLDYFVGLPFTWLFLRPAQFERRKYYGKAGEYREQRYHSGLHGLEYRVLTPELFNHPAFFSLFTKAAVAAIYFAHEKRAVWLKEWDDLIPLAINEGKDLDKLLFKTLEPVVDECYTPNTLLALKKKLGRKGLFTFSNESGGDWTTWSKEWGISRG